MGWVPWVITPSEELERGRGDNSSWPLLDSSSVLWLPSDSLKMPDYMSQNKESNNHMKIDNDWEICTILT